MRTAWSTIALLVTVVGCTTTPTPAPAEDGTRTRLLEIARLEDAKQRADGRLAALLEDSHPEVRLAAVRALAHIRHADDAGALAECFDDDDLRVLRAAIFASGLLPDAPAAPLLPLLEHSDAQVRATALEALGRIGDAASLEAVVAGLADPQAEVRGEAALACWRLQLAAPAVAEGSPDSLAVVLQHAVHGKVLPIARAAAGEPDADARWKMVYSIAGLRRNPPRSGPAPIELGETATAELRVLLTACAADPDPRVRGNAALAIQRVWGEDAGAQLLPMLADEDWSVRIYVLSGLRQAGDPASLAGLRTAAVADAHALVRSSALEALARAGDSLCVQAAAAGLRDSSATVRRAAFGLWAQLQRGAALPQLEQGLAEPDAFTRAAAIRALGAVYHEEAAEEGLPAKLRSLLAAALEVDETGAAAVMDACATLPLQLAVELLDRGLRIDVLEVRGSACGAIQGRAEELLASEHDLTGALIAAWEASQDASEYELRQEVIRCFAALQMVSARPLLNTALSEDPHAAVRETAAEALGQLGQENVVLPELPPQAASTGPDAVSARAASLPTHLRLVTSRGAMRLELFVEDAPLHCYNLVSLARQGFYDGLVFHRVVPSFVIQGGDPRGTGWGDAGYTLNNEVNPRRYLRGTLGMPDAGLDTGGCQLFITHVPTPHLDGRYTVFGRVVEGLEVIDQIEVGDIIERVVIED